jgi:hypothetical protein
MLAARTETCFMSGKRFSIAQLMIVVALAAVDLAVARATPWEIVTFPTVWVAMGILNFLVVWKMILRRTFRAFHYTFLIILPVAFVVMANNVAMEVFHPLGTLVRWYQQLSGKNTNSISLIGFVRIGEGWMAAFLSVALAYAVGWVATWLERHRAWDIAAFWRGVLIGLLVAALATTLDDVTWGWLPVERFSIRWIGRLIVLGASLIFGAWLGLSRLKSSRSDLAGQIG